jgi:hypothetical protein
MPASARLDLGHDDSLFARSPKGILGARRETNTAGDPGRAQEKRGGRRWASSPDLESEFGKS